MGLLDQAASNGSGTHRPAARPDRDAADPLGSESASIRVNWLFSGVVLGAAGWLLILGVIFAVLVGWLVAAPFFAGFCLCLLAMSRAGRRARSAPRSGHGRHRAVAADDEVAA